MKKKIITLTTAIICILTLCGCGNAKLKDGSEVAFKVNGENFSSEKIYKKLKSKYGVSVMVDMIDSEILNTIYKDNETIEKQVKNQIESLKQQYSDNWDTVLKSSGFDGEDELEDYYKLYFQRAKAVDDYVKDSIKEDEIKKYYNENAAGDISAKHILIKVDTTSDNGLTDEEAKEKAKNIIKKLNKGEDFDTLAKENSDDTGSKENGGDLGYFNKGDMVKEFEEAAYSLKVNEYTKEPVKTTYGYHIILKTGEKKKPKYKDIKTKIIETLANNRLEDDKTINVTALDDIRQKYGLKISDSKLKSEYKKYIQTQLDEINKSN